jgi:hypothetical protein
MDWVAELEASKGIKLLEKAFNTVNSTVSDEEYLEAPDGSIALAAAEVVAAMLGRPDPQLPQEVQAWIAAGQGTATPALAASASKAVSSVLQYEQSELMSLWGDAESSDAQAWTASGRSLLARLQS